jgi:putative spermidine/putrescine transport system ATP-binding protein
VGGQVITALQAESEAASALAAHTQAGQRVALSWAQQHMVMLDA